MLDLALINGILPFGTFVANFASLNSNFFSLEKWLDSFDNLCKMTDEESFLSDYLLNLGKLMGLKNVSIFDLPSILARPTKQMLLHPTFGQSFLHTRCRENPNFRVSNIHKCYRKWRQIIKEEEQDGKRQKILKT